MLQCNLNLTKVFLYLVIVWSVLLVFYYGFLKNDLIRNTIVYRTKETKLKYVSFINYSDKAVVQMNDDVYNVWCIFTKVGDSSPLKLKFRNLVWSAMKYTSVPLRFNVIIDYSSKEIAIKVLERVLSESGNKTLLYNFYDIRYAVSEIQDIYQQMIPHFSSSRPGAYYSDALFYLSLGLYRIAPLNQDQVVMLDCDLQFVDDIKLLFDQFNSFQQDTLFGLAPELSPVYHHVLHDYRHKHNTTFGDFLHPQYKVPFKTRHPFGYQGYNSGAVLFKLNRIRESEVYPNLFRKDNVDNTTAKYNFRGHLGDQDFYTIMGYEYPELFYSLPCVFNRQLCTWWRDRGYSNTFDKYFKCDGNIVIYHGNCNTRIP